MAFLLLLGMKKIIYFIIIFPLLVNAQKNLVLNESFEKMNKCPDDQSQIYYCNNWISANDYGTPDFFSLCSLPSQISAVPFSGLGYQYPRTGSNFVGIQCFHTLPNYAREFLEAKLKGILKKNKYYYSYFNVSLSYSIIPCYTDAIGLAFSNKLEIDTNKTILTRQKAVIHQKGKVIKDTAGWEKISGVYRGNDEEYLIIGNFFKDSELTIDPTCYNSFPNSSYYFIDDVGVYEYDPLPDTLLLCKGQTKRVGGRFLDATYKWSTGATDSMITVSKAGRYIVTATMDGKYELSDTLYVLNPEAVVATYVKDTVFCKGEIFSLTLPNIGTYQWSNASKNNVFTTKSAGNYQLTLTTDCGIYKHEIDLKEEDCTCNIYIPNAFSPNGDQINDALNCYVKCAIDFKVLRFQVFDRWGNQVYFLTDTTAAAIAWDGTFRGELLEQGVYTYALEYEYVEKGKIIKENKISEFILMR